VRIVIGEDSALFREGLARLLEDAGHKVVARAGDATTLMEAVEREQPDLAIIDVRMPPDGTDDGARAAKKLANPGFVAKARPEVVEAEREKLARLEAEREALG